MFREALEASGGGSTITPAAFLQVGREHQLSAPSVSKGVVYALVPGNQRRQRGAGGAGTEHASSLFALLESTWATAKPEVEAQIAAATFGAEEHKQRLQRFKQLLSKRQDASAAWESYRMLLLGVSNAAEG